MVFVFTAIVDRYSDIIRRFKSVNLSLAPVVTTQFPSRRLTQIASACGSPRRILRPRAIPWVCGLTTRCWVPSFSSPCIFWRPFHISTQRSSAVLLSLYGIPLGGFTIVDVKSPTDGRMGCPIFYNFRGGCSAHFGADTSFLMHAGASMA